MKAENKIFRIAVLILGIIIYWVFFATYWSDKYWYLDQIDLRNSFVVQMIDIVLSEIHLFKSFNLHWLFEIVRAIVILFAHIFYLYWLWSSRENIVVSIKNFIKKI